MDQIAPYLTQRPSFRRRKIYGPICKVGIDGFPNHYFVFGFLGEKESLCCVNIKCSIKNPDSRKYHSHHSIIIRLAGFAFSKDLKDLKRKSGKSRKIRGGDPAARVPLIGGLPPLLPSFKIISS